MSRDVPCGLADGRTEWRTNMTKLMVAIRNFAKTQKKKKNLSPTILPEEECESLSETLQYIYPDDVCQVKLSYNNSS